MKDCGIIFDCDGTLVDSLTQALDSFNYALVQVGEPARTPEQIKRYFGAGADRILTRIVGDESKGKAAFSHYLEHQTQLAEQTQLHRGVRQLLEDAASARIPMAVVTGRHAHDLEVVLRPHGINDYFVTLVADNHAANSKPAPDGVLLAAERMGLDPARTFYVGDAVYDIQAARAAGSVAVGALWDPLAKREDLTAASADYLAKRPDEVRALFYQHFSL